MQDLIINEELKTLLPPLSAEEFAGLEADILEHGCISPLIVWNSILVDGHHRYEICQRHEIPFSVQNIVFDDLDAAKLWAWKHQEHRRNLTLFHRAELALRFKDKISAKAKERQLRKPADAVPAMLPEQKETREELAEIAGVSPRTLAKAEFVAEHADDETKERLRAGEKGTSISKEYNRLKAEIKSDDTVHDEFAETEDGEGYYPPLSQPIPEEDSQFVQTVKLQNIPVKDPERLIGCLFDLFDVKYRETLVYDLLARISVKDGKKIVQRIMNKLNKVFSK